MKNKIVILIIASFFALIIGTLAFAGECESTNEAEASAEGRSGYEDTGASRDEPTFILAPQNMLY